MIVVDTTVVVAASSRFHTFYEAATDALPRQRTRLLAPVAVEAYAVLTRAPLPLRVTGAVADEYLRSKFAFPVVSLPAADYDRVLGVAAERKLVGGAIYDAIVAATARHAGATLLTLDRRATRTYEAIGVDYKLVA